MKLFKRFIAAAATAAIVATSVVGCADVSTVGTVDGKDIKAGIYLWFELAAMGEAQSEIDEQLEKLGESSTDIENFSYFDYNVQEKPFSEFVINRTEELVKQYVAVMEKFEELELELTAEEKAEIKTNVGDLWNTDMTYYGYSMGMTYGDYYEERGIGKSSYESIQLADKMNNKLFDAYYEENGITPTDEKDIKTYFDDNYGRFYMIEVSLTEGNGDKIDTDEGKAEMKKLAQGYLDRLKKGEDFDEVYHDYETYVEEQKELAEDKDSSTTSAEESTTVVYDNTDSDATSSGAGDAEEEDHDHETLLSKTDTSPSEKFVKWAFELKEEEGGIYEDETIYYVVLRKPLLDRTDWFDTYRLSILHEMKDEEFEEILNDFAKDYAVNFTEAALNKYHPEKIVQ